MEEPFYTPYDRDPSRERRPRFGKEPVFRSNRPVNKPQLPRMDYNKEIRNLKSLVGLMAKAQTYQLRNWIKNIEWDFNHPAEGMDEHYLENMEVKLVSTFNLLDRIEGYIKRRRFTKDEKPCMSYADVLERRKIREKEDEQRELQRQLKLEKQSMDYSEL